MDIQRRTTAIALAVWAAVTATVGVVTVVALADDEPQTSHRTLDLRLVDAPDGDGTGVRVFGHTLDDLTGIDTALWRLWLDAVDDGPEKKIAGAVTDADVDGQRFAVTLDGERLLVSPGTELRLADGRLVDARRWFVARGDVAVGIPFSVTATVVDRWIVSLAVR